VENIKLNDLKEFLEPWTRAMSRQYGSQFTQEAPQLVVNAITLHGKDGKPQTLIGGTLIRVISGSDRDDVDPTKTFVTFQIVGPEKTPDGKSKTGHGSGNPYAGKIHTVPRSTYLYAVQPGAAPASTASPSPMQ
jgi:hypothetical protein